MSLDVAHNPWLSCAAWLTLRLLVVGGAWSWLILPEQDRIGPVSAWRRRAVGVAAALWSGVVLNGLVASVLAEYGLYSRWGEGVVLGAIVLAGWAAGSRRLSSGWRSHWGDLAPSVALLLPLFSAAMLLPDRGEWIAGGWDPGIYVNQGVQVSRTGTYHPKPSALLTELRPDEWALFTQRHHGFTAYFPVVPIDPETRSVHPYFFRFTPSMIAVLERCGGLRAATRINLVIGVVGAIQFLGFLLAHRRSTAAVAAALGLLIIHPIWVFMAHFPTSEMLQFVLVFGLFMLLPWRDRGPVSLIAIPLGLLAAMMNRFSFFPFAGLFLCLLTWLDQDRGDRRRVFAERLLQAAGVAAGLTHDLMWCGEAIGRLDELTLPLLLGGAGGTGLALLLERVRLRTGRTRVPLSWINRRRLLSSVAGSIAAGVALGRLPVAASHTNAAGNLAGALPWLGPGLLAVAAAGYAMLVIHAERVDRPFVIVVVFLGLCAAITLTIAAIAALYPWAVRRHLVYTVPFLVLCAAEGIGCLLRAGGPRAWLRVVGATALLAAIAGGAQRSLHAWQRTDFNGLSGILASAARHAEGPGRLVVADHFRWGTPLHLIYGLQVLNGEYLWGRPVPEENTAAALRVLARLHDSGWTIQWLTSTSEGLSVYAHPIPGAVERWSSGPIDIADLKHGLWQTDFVQRRREKVFTLYEWRPPPE